MERRKPNRGRNTIGQGGVVVFLLFKWAISGGTQRGRTNFKRPEKSSHGGERDEGGVEVGGGGTQKRNMRRRAGAERGGRWGEWREA